MKKIDQIKKENENILTNKQNIQDKLKKEEQKIINILNLVSELKESFQQNNNSNKTN